MFNVDKQQTNQRYYVIAILACGFLLFLVYWLIRLQLVEGDFLLSEGNKRSIRIETISAHRGIIFDRNGNPLAISTQMPSIWAVPEELLAAKEKLPNLSSLLGLSKDKLEADLLANTNRDFRYLKRHVLPDLGEKILEFKIPGVHIMHQPKRYYPASEVTSHVVGITDIDDVGQEGIELAFNQVLTGSTGKQKLYKDRKGSLIKQTETITAVKPGQEITLSIDLRIQYIAHQSLLDGIKKAKAKSGSVVVLDINTGEILALVNYPTYNPNNKTVLDHASLRNRAINDVFEPGSALKPFIIAAALESKLYNKNSIINTYPGYLMIAGHKIHDFNNYGKLTFTQILTKSSNVGVSKIAFTIGTERLRNLFYRLQFGQPTGIGFFGEHSGFLTSKDNLSRLELATLSFGYGLLVTPLQLARAYMILGSGVYQPLTIIKQSTIVKGERIFNQEIVNSILPMLSAVVDHGSGRLASSSYVKVGGKTGTSRKVKNKGYNKNTHSSIFAGLVPIEQPKLAIVVVIDEPAEDKYYASKVAAPIFSKVATGAAKIVNILQLTPNILQQ